MTTTDLALSALLGFVIWAFVAYWVVRKAVSAGILDADRMKERAAAERALVKRQMERDEGS